MATDKRIELEETKWFVLIFKDKLASDHSKTAPRQYAQYPRSEEIQSPRFDVLWNALGGPGGKTQFRHTLAQQIRELLKNDGWTADKANEFYEQDCGVELDIRCKEEETTKNKYGKEVTTVRKINVDVYYHFGKLGDSKYKDPPAQEDILKTEPSVDKTGLTWKLIFHIERASLLSGKAYSSELDVDKSTSMREQLLVWIKEGIEHVWRGLSDMEWRKKVATAHSRLLDPHHPNYGEYNHQIQLKEVLHPSRKW